jgi:hypothetical protein
MKKSIISTDSGTPVLETRTPTSKVYWIVSLIFLSGCTTTQLRWDAIGMRQQVIKYYNDEIMENLIRADEKLPFVHVDITGLTTIDTSQISGSISGGETTGFTRNSPSMMGAIHTISRAVTSPFSYSVAPQRGNSLQFSAAPVLSPVVVETGETATESSGFATNQKESNGLVTIKETEVRETRTGPVKSLITEKTQPPPPKPKSTTIYKLYEDFVRKNKGTAFLSVEGIFPPSDNVYVPGTLKRWGTRYYYIHNDRVSKERYYRFCKTLFTKSQGQPQATELQTVETAIQGVRGLQALPESPSIPR